MELHKFPNPSDTFSLNKSLGKAALLCYAFIMSCTLNAPAASPSNSSPSSHYLVICLYLQSAGPPQSLWTLPWPARGVISHRRLRPGLRGGDASAEPGHIGLLLSCRCNQWTMMEIVSQWDCYDTINGAKFDWTDTLQLRRCFGWCEGGYCLTDYGELTLLDVAGKLLVYCEINSNVTVGFPKALSRTLAAHKLYLIFMANVLKALLSSSE